jgi:hypothetical protein
VRAQLAQRNPERFLGLDTGPCALQARLVQLVGGKLSLGSNILDNQQA